MKNKNRILISTIFGSTIILTWLAILAIADIPPPPVDQNLGIYDTNMTSYNEILCRDCHNNATFSGMGIYRNSIMIGGVPTRHHNLVNITINPFTNQAFQCIDCHPSNNTSGILIDRNCMNCHNGTAFWGNSIGANVGSFTRPHHNTTNAQLRKCKFCHGALVDDYNDNHSIPSGPEDQTTPSSTWKVFNSTSGRLWGGCMVCHAENDNASPPILFTQTDPTPVNGKYSSTPIATGKNNVHHDEIIGIDQPPNVPLVDQCKWCHPNLTNILDIRGCELCHSVEAIHNTQVNFTNTNTLSGYGHIGSNNSLDPTNNSRDCNGCHSWCDGNCFTGINSFLGAIIPDIQSTTPLVINVNNSANITLNGTNFNQTGDTTVVNIDDAINITPNDISDNQINVTVNLTTVGNHYIKVIKTDPTENIPKPSSIRPLTVVSNPSIQKAILNPSFHILAITGKGFGNKPANAQQYVDIVKAGTGIFYSDNIISWSDTMIFANASKAANGDDVIVMTNGSGEASINIQ